MVEKVPIIGKTIGDYVVEELIGRGNYAYFFKARHTELGEPAFIRVIDPSLTENKDILDSIVRESELLTSLPENELTHIAKHLDVGVIENTGTEYDGCTYTIMEYMDRGSMEDNLNDMNIDERVACITDAIKGLEVTHQYGILHLDFHLGNILMDSNKGVKLSGFGIGAQLDVVENSHIDTRRPSRKKAPEQMGPEPQVRRETDVYQVGAVLMFVTTGMEPVEGSRKLLRSGYPHIPSKLKDVIDQCLEWEYNKRPSLSEVRQRLEDLPTTSLEYKTNI